MSVVVVQPAPTIPTQPQPILSNGNITEHSQDNTEQTKSKPLIGIIYPPPEVRNIIDRTAEFVARNGPAYETKVRDSETGNNKFNFLHMTDPYHAYYRMRVNGYKEGKVMPSPMMHITTGSAPKPSIQTIKLDSLVPKEPPAEFEFLAEPPSISSLDLDIVKLTAQFAAQHGRSFVNRLMDKEQKNYQFDFLRPQHSLFTYFNKLIEQYQNVLIPPKNVLEHLSKDIYTTDNLFERVEKRFHWNTYQRRQRRGEEEKYERERVAYAQIDWHDFVVVETINFTEEESGFFPPPVTPHTLTARLIAQAKHEARANADEFTEVREVEMEDDIATPAEAPPPRDPEPIAPPPVINTAPPVQEGDIIIRSDYDPKARPQLPTAGPGVDKYLTSPITGEIVPSEKATSHVKHLLVDSKWRESQNKLINQQHQQVEVYAEGSQITQNLRGLAERRTDIFGSEETVIGRTIGEDQGPEAMALASELAQGGVLDDALKALKYTIEESPKIGPSMPHKPQQISAPVNPIPIHMLPTHTPLPLPRAPAIEKRLSAPTLAPAPPPRPMGDIRQPFSIQQPNPGMIQRPTLSGNFPPMIAPQQYMHPPPNPEVMHPRPPQYPPSLAMHDPMAKRPRTEEEMLVHEDEFIRYHPGPVSFRVQCPQLPEKPEWNLNGQILTINLPVEDQVSVIKAMIAAQIDMPIGKQKLQLGSIFLKDSNSLGFYNISEETVVQLVVKERGGRKK
ncbi:hypothetical protein LOD99_13530 [Oopsacas minuta]|uniref:Splicing factor 3A subunit 1 n=1 Tax=Oopsacas minuta TaxID=111878 RepID=A0AAV7KJU8_9METZ|nr:hypothetical protein LOD99_13530 [Oopsacas minuta]